MNTINTLNGVILASRDEVTEHAENPTVHLTEEERIVWNAKADAAQLDAKVDAATFTAHETNQTVHVSEEEKEKWNARTTKGVVAATQDGLDEHIENTRVHITEEERTAWNSAVVIPESSITYTGGNTHMGAEEFNGPISINSNLVVNGKNILRTLAERDIEAAFSVGLAGTHPGAVIADEQMKVVYQIRQQLNAFGLNYYYGGDVFRLNWNLKLITNDYPGGLVWRYYQPGFLNNGSWVGVAYTTMHQIDAQICTCWMLGGYDWFAENTVYTMSSEEALAPETILDIPETKMLCMLTVKALHVFVRGRHDIINYTSQNGRPLVTLRSPKRRVVILTWENQAGWIKIYDSGDVVYGSDRYCSGVAYWSNDLDKRTLTSGNAMIFPHPAAQWVDMGIFDD